jgi:hypothetical protein
MSANGHNPMYYNCETQGCFNKKRRPKIEDFCTCFPGKISFGDIDGVVEINGYTLMLEWKGNDQPIPKGQATMHRKTTFYGNNSVICIHGDPETMAVWHVGYFHLGRWTDWHEQTLPGAKEAVSSWAQWAMNQPQFMSLDAIIPILLTKHGRQTLLNAVAHFASEKAAA